jgi:hypothetical protein
MSGVSNIATLVGCAQIPSGSGKTTLASHVGFIDVDDLTRDADAFLKPMRRRAMTNPLVWKEHNELRTKAIVDKWREFARIINPGFYILLDHGPGFTVPDALGIPRSMVTGFKIAKPLHEAAITQRESESRTLAQLNWKQSNGRIMNSWGDLSRAVFGFAASAMVQQSENFAYIILSTNAEKEFTGYDDLRRREAFERASSATVVKNIFTQSSAPSTPSSRSEVSSMDSLMTRPPQSYVNGPDRIDMMRQSLIESLAVVKSTEGSGSKSGPE